MVDPVSSAGAAAWPLSARPPPAQRLAAHVPSLLEFLFAAAVVGLLLPSFAAVAQLGAGRDDRFLDHPMVVAGLPDPALPEACEAVAAQAEPGLRRALCGGRAESSATASISPTALPSALIARLDQAAQAFAVPLREAEARRSALRAEAQSGGAELRARGDEAAALDEAIVPFVARFRLDADVASGPKPLRCVRRWAERAAGEGGATGASSGPALARAGAAGTVSPYAGADAVLLLAAALDGRPAAAALAAERPLPLAAVPGCPDLVESIATASAVMADARQAGSRAAKNAAMRELAPSAGLQWALAMAMGYVFLRWSRRSDRPMLGVGVALIAWSAAAWAARVPWSFAPLHDFVPARAGPGWASAPALFVVLPAVVGALLIGVAWLRARSGSTTAAPASQPRQAMSSRVGYAGFVLATGVGALLLLDLSFNGHPLNRYLALYHQGHLWLAMLLLSVAVFVRRPLARALAWLLSIGAEANARLARVVGRAGAVALLMALAAAGVLAVAVALSDTRQLTSELGRIWLICGAAWFFFLRAGPMAERLARTGPASLAFLRTAGPLLFVVGVLVAMMFATRDMGPLLIAGYAAGAFVAATVAMWWHHRSGRVLLPLVASTLLFALWIAGATAALFELGAHDSVTASRLESVAAPFASINDQLALVSWFQAAVPPGGFGIGAVPWCGFATDRCGGVPAQIHSDYTFTAMIGVFGALAAWALAIVATLWLHRLIRHHGRVTRGEPRLLDGGGRLAADGQALISWIGVAWVALVSCQLVVTVAGNLAVLPLTGVTFPFVSFGMTSLLVNVAFLSLCLNVDLPPGARDG